MPRFSLKVAMGGVIVLSILAIPIVQAARAEADATVLGARVMARLRAVPPETWFESMQQGGDMRATFRTIATDEGRSLLDTGEVAQLSVVDITTSAEGTQSVAAVPMSRVRNMDPRTGEGLGEGGQLIRLLRAESVVTLRGVGERRFRYFVIVDLSAVERARSLRTVAVIVAVVLAALAGMAAVWSVVMRRARAPNAGGRPSVALAE